MTNDEALEIVRGWWLRSVPLLNSTADRGFRPNLEPTRFGWALWLRGSLHRFVEGQNLFSGHTVAEVVQAATEQVEFLLKDDP